MVDSGRSDPELLERWLVILGLIANAESMLIRRGGAWTALALVTADAAIEGMLALAASTKQKASRDRDGFEAILDLGADALGLDPAFCLRIRRAHRQRNIALHVGGEPGLGTVKGAIATARELRSIAAASTPVLETLGDVGPIQAVARLVQVPEIANALTAADELLIAGRMTEAVNQAAIAFEVAIERIEPPIRSRLAHSERIADRETLRFLHWTRQSLQLHETHLLALASGLSANELTRLQRTLGNLDRDSHRDPPWLIERDASIDLSPPHADAAVLMVADVIFRLTLNEAIRLREPWEKG